MCTFKIYVYPTLRKDGNHTVAIVIGWKRDRSYMLTEYLVSPKQLTKNREIKDGEFVKKQLLDRIARYQDIKVRRLGSKINLYTAEELMRYFQQNDVLVDERLDFFSFAENLQKREGTKRTNNIFLASLKNFAKREHLYTHEINLSFLESYDRWLRGREVALSSINTYMNRFRAIFNEMKKRFNDEDRDDILIPQNPFRKYAWPQVLETKKRALTIEQIKKIRDMELDKHRTVARDAFMLSLYLAGMNTVDLYTATNCKDGRITYNRTKTATRRKDAALISIRVFPETQKLLDIYRDHSRVFDFYKRYKSAMQFNHIVNLYLKEIGRSIGIEDLEFGAARASFATIARNNCGISKYDIHESLNHTDSATAIDDIYILRDFSVVDGVVKAVIDALKEETPTPVLQVVRDSKESLSA